VTWEIDGAGRNPGADPAQVATRIEFLVYGAPVEHRTVGAGADQSGWARSVECV